ncbi:MAG: CvpA family protein [Candidatus Cloacimonadota bacterium]|nr:MAG: CvpA family protein [Candidatus Cloacimonadota bacterium]
MFWYDIFTIAIIAAGFLYGFLKGIISEIFALAGLVIGFIIAMKFSFIIQPYILPLVKKETLALILSFILLFLVSAASIIVLGIFFKKTIKFIRLSWLDRVIGGIFGFVKGVIIAGLISLLIFTFFPGGKAFIKKSTLGRHTITIVRIAVYLLPQKVQKKLHESTTEKERERFKV